MKNLPLPAGCPLVLALIAVNVLLWLGQGASQGLLTQLGVLYGPAVQDGQWWRLVSSGFLHANLMHIGFNMFLLYALGQQLEQGIGSARFGAIYAAALFGGALAVMLFDWNQPTLGASGAVMGVAAAFGVAVHAQGGDPRRHPVFGLVILNLALPLLVPAISFWGHLGGVVGGGLAAWLIVWRPVRARRGGGSPLATLTGIGGVTVVALAAAALIAGRLGGLA